MELPFDVEKVNSTLLGGLNQVLAKWLHKDDSSKEEDQHPKETAEPTTELTADPSQTSSANTKNNNANVLVKKITIKRHSGYYKVKRFALKARVNKEASIKKIAWSSSNKKYVSVNSRGRVSIKKAGIGKTVSITAKATDGSRVQKVIKIKVMKKTGKRFLIKLKK